MHMRINQTRDYETSAGIDNDVARTRVEILADCINATPPDSDVALPVDCVRRIDDLSTANYNVALNHECTSPRRSN
jgi:hypothetical protein